MSPQGAIRAVDQGGPDGLLTYFSRNGRPGATPQQNFDLLSQLTANMMMLKGNPEGALHAEEYYFRLQHRGAVQNTMKALTAYNTGDLQSAAQLLARAHAFVPDGAVVGFTVAGNQIIGQRYSDDSHQKIGNSFTVNASDIRAASAQVSDPVQFHTLMNQERVTNGNLIHQANEDQHNFDTLGSTAREQDIQLAGQSSVAQTAANALVETKRRNDLLDQYHQDELQARINKADQDRQTRIDIQRMKGGAVDKAGERAIRKEGDSLYGDLAMTPPVDALGQPLTDSAKAKAQNLYYGLITANPKLQSLQAQRMVRSLAMDAPAAGGADPRAYGIYKTKDVDGAGRPLYGIHDLQGNRVAYLPPQTLEQLGVTGAGMPNETPPVRGRKL